MENRIIPKHPEFLKDNSDYPYYHIPSSKVVILFYVMEANFTVGFGIFMHKMLDFWEIVLVRAAQNSLFLSLQSYSKGPNKKIVLNCSLSQIL